VENKEVKKCNSCDSELEKLSIEELLQLPNTVSVLVGPEGVQIMDNVGLTEDLQKRICEECYQIAVKQGDTNQHRLFHFSAKEVNSMIAAEDAAKRAVPYNSAFKFH